MTTAAREHPLSEVPIRPHPDAAYQVLPYPDPAPRLPAGYGGLAVRTWYRRRLMDKGATVLPLPPMTGVDGKPALWGWGTALVVLPAGQHLVQVQVATTEAERMVTVAEGEVVTLEYAAARNLSCRGVLGRPGQRQPGLPYGNTFLAIAMLYVPLVAIVGARDYPIYTVGYPAVASLPAAFIAAALIQRHIDRRARIRAAGPPVPAPAVTAGGILQFLDGKRESVDDRPALPDGLPSTAEVPHFLGAAPPHDPPEGCGALVLTSSFRTEVETAAGSWSPHVVSTWTPPPTVRIDGRPAPASWSTWWYPLPAGPHEIEVVEPAYARLRVEMVAGNTHYVHCRARIRIVRDRADSHVVDQQARVTLHLDRPRRGRAKATRSRILA